MKITTLIAAAALATASTTAFAEGNVTTEAGDLVIIEKNQFAGNEMLIPIVITGGIAAIVIAGGTR